MFDLNGTEYGIFRDYRKNYFQLDDNVTRVYCFGYFIYPLGRIINNL